MFSDIEKIFYSQIILLTTFGFLVFVSNGFALDATNETEISIVIAATSDLHGWLDTTTIYPKTRPTGLLYIAEQIESLRKQHPSLILLDAGDLLQGSPSNYYYNWVDFQERPLPIVHLMNVLGYDAIALGNHDLEPPLKVFQTNRAHSNFFWLSGNVSTPHGALELPAYQIFLRQGLRIAVLGLTTPGIPMWINSEHLKNVQVQDMIASAKRWVSFLKEDEKVDVLVGLFHSGVNYWYDQYESINQKVPIPNAAGLIADHVPGFDVIISGHAHRTYPSRKVTSLNNFQQPIVGPGHWGRGISVIQFFLKNTQNGWQIQKKEFNFLRAQRKLSQKYQSLVKKEMKAVATYLEQPTRTVLLTQPERSHFYQCSEKITHDALKGMKKTFVRSLLPGQWRWRKFLKSDFGHPIKRRHLFQWLPYDNTLVEVQLFGRQIELLMKPYLQKQQGGHYRARSYLSPGGFQIEPQPLAQWGYHILDALDHAPLKPSTRYPVWITNYHWNGGRGLRGQTLIHTSQKSDEIVMTLRDLVMHYLTELPFGLPLACQGFLQLENTTTSPPLDLP